MRYVHGVRMSSCNNGTASHHCCVCVCVCLCVFVCVCVCEYVCVCAWRAVCCRNHRQMVLTPTTAELQIFMRSYINTLLCACVSCSEHSMPANKQREGVAGGEEIKR